MNLLHAVWRSPLLMSTVAAIDVILGILYYFFGLIPHNIFDVVTVAIFAFGIIWGLANYRTIGRSR